MPVTRPAAVAGTFYPREPQHLRRVIDDCLRAAPAPPAGARPKLLVVPHAGYVYSGPVAASAYRRLAPWAGAIRRVVLLGPSHRVALRGLAVPEAEALSTPLGEVPVDATLRLAVQGLPQVFASDRVHAFEHSLEVQLPFLQTVLPAGFGVLPLAVGDATPADVAAVVERLWGGAETLIAVSSDLSHYLPWDEARRIDAATAARILDCATDLEAHEACGARALNGALAAARRHGLRGELLDLRNSGDTAGDRQRVVGYAALAFTEPGASGAGTGDDEAATAAEPALGQALLARAHNSIAGALGFAKEPEAAHPALRIPGATFVSLHDARGALRGCVGRLVAQRPLDDDVRHNARAAAFEDPRFAPLAAHEWHGLQIEVSLLGTVAPLAGTASLHEAAAALRPGRDGVILAWRGRQATFLPQVWDQLPRPLDFLTALLSKAGLPAEFWAADVALSRYAVHRFVRAPVQASAGGDNPSALRALP